MTDSIIGIVIKKVQLNADDEVITILTSEEIVSFIALGVRKITSKNRFALDYGNIINAEIFRARLVGKLSKLKTATIVKQPPILISDTANVILTIVKNISNLENASEKLFNAILKSYSFLGDTYNHWVKTYIMFNVLDALGIYPIFNKCIDCNRSDRINSFDYKQGGFLCAWHTKQERPIDELKAIQALDKGIEEYIKVAPDINKLIYEELIVIISDYIYIKK